MEDANCAYQLGKLATKAQQLPEAVTLFEEVGSRVNDFSARLTKLLQASNGYRRAQAPSEEGWCLYRLALVMIKCNSIATATSYLSDVSFNWSRCRDEATYN